MSRGLAVATRHQTIRASWPCLSRESQCFPPHPKTIPDNILTNPLVDQLSSVQRPMCLTPRHTVCLYCFMYHSSKRTKTGKHKMGSTFRRPKVLRERPCVLGHIRVAPATPNEPHPVGGGAGEKGAHVVSRAGATRLWFCFSGFDTTQSVSKRDPSEQRPAAPTHSCENTTTSPQGTEHRGKPHALRRLQRPVHSLLAWTPPWPTDLSRPRTHSRRATQEALTQAGAAKAGTRGASPGERGW